MSTSAWPWTSTASANFNDSRSVAASRLIGKAPRWLRIAPNHLTLKSPSLAMKKTLRGEMKRVKAKSTFERWMGAISTGPVRGMFSRPLTWGRKSSRDRPDRMVATT
jgi:hypothetical protein